MIDKELLNSLNDILDRSIEIIIGTLTINHISLFRSFDERMPPVYHLTKDREMIREVALGLGNALREIPDVLLTEGDRRRNFGSERRRDFSYKISVRTIFEDDLQKVFLENNRPTPVEVVRNINEKIKLATHRSFTYSRHGNLIAAQKLEPYGGRIFLENLPQEGEWDKIAPSQQ